MHFQSLALLAAATVAAADSTVSLFLPGFDTQSLEAKILGSQGSMTTYLLNCPAGEDPSDCGLAPNGYTIIEDSSSMIGGFSYETETVSQSCKLQGTTHANCLWTIYSDGTTTSTSVDFDVSSLPFGGFMPVHVTATQTGGVSASTAASVSASTATSTGTSTGSAVTSTSTASGSNTATATASRTESTNAAMPKMTGNAHWVAGGAAAALALAVV